MKTTCRDCGEVEVYAEAIRLRVFAANVRQSFYAARCPGCSVDIYHPAPPVVVSLLATAVTPVVWDVPDELLEVHTGPAINYDDALTFGLALEATPSGVSSFDPAKAS